MPKYIISPLDGDVNFPILTVFSSTQDMGHAITTAIGPNQPYFGFTSLPTVLLLADGLGADFEDAPLSADPDDPKFNPADPDYNPAVPTYAHANRDTFAAQAASPVAVGETNDGINKVWKVA